MQIDAHGHKIIRKPPPSLLWDVDADAGGDVVMATMMMMPMVKRLKNWIQRHDLLPKGFICIANWASNRDPEQQRQTLDIQRVYGGRGCATAALLQTRSIKTS